MIDFDDRLSGHCDMSREEADRYDASIDLDAPPLPVSEIVRRGERRIAATRAGKPSPQDAEFTRLRNALALETKLHEGTRDSMRNVVGQNRDLRARVVELEKLWGSSGPSARSIRAETDARPGDLHQSDREPSPPEPFPAPCESRRDDGSRECERVGAGQ